MTEGRTRLMELEELSKGKGALLGRMRIENVFLAARIDIRSLGRVWEGTLIRSRLTAY